VREGQGIVEADIYDAQGRFMNNLRLQGRLLLPTQETLNLPFAQVAPGRYAGRFPMQGNGEYLLSLVGESGEQTVGPKTVGISVPYSPEYLGLDINYGLLNRLAERTGGRVLRPDAVAEAGHLLFTTPGQNISILQDYWPWFVILALCLFVGEVAVRQLLLPTAWTTPRQRRETRQEPVPEYAYSELEAIVHLRADERRRRNTGSRDGHNSHEATTDQAWHFYLAGLRDRRRKS
jgi:hypothetical protein